MESPTKILIKEILILSDISVRKLAKEVGVEPSTLSRIIAGTTRGGMASTYMKIFEYKKRILREMVFTVIDKDYLRGWEAVCDEKCSVYDQPGCGLAN